MGGQCAGPLKALAALGTFELSSANRRGSFWKIVIFFNIFLPILPFVAGDGVVSGGNFTDFLAAGEGSALPLAEGTKVSFLD